ncbi:MAG: deoxycytidylate deaminase [Thermoplasmatota archaeon]
MDRPTVDEYFMTMAELAASRSTCLRRHVGAVIVRDKQVISSGYNGAPKDLPHCEEVGCRREQMNVKSGTRHELCRGVHAEQNAVIQAAVFGVSVKDGTLYCTHHPCVLCMKILINAGIKRIVYKEGYPDELAREIIEESDIEIEEYSGREKEKIENILEKEKST